MSLGLGLNMLGHAITSVLSGTPWSPLSLFQAGEPGLAYDTMDLSSFYSDRDGATAATVNGECGLLIDKHLGTLGANIISNGTFDSGAGWTTGAVGTTTVTISGGSARYVTAGADYVGLVQAAVQTVGQWYLIEFDVLAGSSGTLKLIGDGVSGGEMQFACTPGAKRFIAPASTTSFGFGRVVGQAADAYIDNVSVRPFPGNHAYQITTANRPILRGTPTGSNLVTGGDMASDVRRNLLARTQQFDNASWSKSASSVSADAAVAPDGTSTADKLIESATTAAHYAVEAHTYSATRYVLSVSAKAAERSVIHIRRPVSGSDAQGATFDLSTGVATMLGTVVSATMVDQGSGWWRCILVCDPPSGGASDFRISLYAGAASYAGDGTSGVYLWGAQLEAASAVTTYQRVDASLYNASWTASASTVEVASNISTWTASSGTLTSSLAATSGRVYRVRYTMTRSAGTLTPSFGGVTLTASSLSGTYEEFVTASSTAALVFTGTAFTGTLDDVVLRDCSADVVSAPYGLQMGTIAGVDRWMQTAAVDFTATDEMTVCMGVRKFSDAAHGVVAELTASVIANNGAFAISAPASAAGNYGFALRASVNYTEYRATPFAAPSAAVVACQYNTSGALIAGEVFPRVNGAIPTLADVGGASGGTGNFANAALYFGKRGGSSSPFQGLWYGGVIRGALTTAELPSLEQWVSARTPETTL